MNKDKIFTNRDWLATLSNAELAEFFTYGIKIANYPYPISLDSLVRSYIHSSLGIEEWLQKPCMYI